MAEFYNPPDLWKPFGAFSMMAIQGAGQIVHLKGQVALTPDGQVVGPGNMRAQVRQVLENIQTALSGVGGDMGDIVSLVHYATDIQAFMASGDIRAAFFRAPFPITTTVEVASLYDPRLVIEITASAEIPHDRFHPPT
ncbi:MAG: RidA family protein [Pseudomonadota bacterium]